ncbi:hypothetical protein LTR15_007680 [Elasticomyces elasticus]|nr:hypothetical protein LTR15_007680 [Elasticomyces elasticus]
MSKRVATSQGGEERYGGMDEGGPRDGPVDKPTKATAAQLAQRRIKEMKKKTPRGSRAGSPAIADPGATGANAFQSFQAPPSTNSFNFSMPGAAPAPSFAQSTTQQNGSTPFGNSQANGAPSFGGFGSTQQTNGVQSTQSTNGWNPGTSLQNFGPQRADTTSTPSTSFSFGQTPAASQEQPKQNGFNPSTSMFGTQTQQPQTNGEQTPKVNPFAGLFGSQSQTNGSTPAPAIGTGLFGSTPAAPATTTAPGQSVFSGLGASSASMVKSNMFSNTPAPQTVEQPPPGTEGALFKWGLSSQANGQAPAQPVTEQPKEAPKYSFGQTSQQSNGIAAPTPSNPFANLSQPKAPETEKAPVKFNFGQTYGENSTSAPTNGNVFTGIFSQPAAETPAKAPEATISNNLFSAVGGQLQDPKTPFKFGQGQITFGQGPSQVEKTPSQNLFGAATPAQTNGAPSINFGASQQDDTSMVTPGNTPHKQNLAVSQPGQQSAQPAPETETPNAGKSMFDRISRDAPVTANKPAFAFGNASVSNDSQVEQTPNPNAGKSMFDRMTPRDPEPPATAPKAPSAPSFSITAPTPIPADKAPSQIRPSAMSAPSTTTSTAAPDRQGLKALNQGILAHLSSEDENQDWSKIMQFYLDQAAKFMGREAVKAPVARAQAPQQSASGPAIEISRAPPPAPASDAPNRNMFAGSFAKPAAPAASSSSQSGTVHAMAPAPPGHSTYAPAPATPKPLASNIFSQAYNPPATEPINRKFSADEALTKSNTFAAPPATEKRSKSNASVEYPKLPETASNTAKLFASTLDKPAPKTTSSGSPSFGPSDDLMTKVREQKAAKEAAQRAEQNGSAPVPSSAFKPSTKFNFGGPSTPAPASEKATAAPMFGFKPADSATAATPGTAFKPSTKLNFGASATAQQTLAPTAAAPAFGFKPSAAPDSAPNFLSAFGKKAESTAEQEKNKRKANDLDSDDDEAEWEAKDQAEQEAKRQKIEELAKAASGFKPAGTNVASLKPLPAPADGSSLLAAFGKKAEKTVEEEMKKRKAEDLDSDDDETEWEARYQAEQEAKRQKIEEAAKSAPTFGFRAAANGDGPSKAPFAFKVPDTPKTTDTSSEKVAEGTSEATKPGFGKSMFDRTTFPDKTSSTPNAFSNAFPTKTTGTPGAPFAKFGQGSSTSPTKTNSTPAISFGAATPAATADKTGPEKEHIQGNNTWNPSTPIKFGTFAKPCESTTPAAAPPANSFGGLFGASAASNGSNSLAPPTVGFSFGGPKAVSTDVSRATTPGVTTDGEASAAGEEAQAEEGEPSDTVHVKPAVDLATLTEEEREAEEVLFEVAVAKARKKVTRPVEEGGSTSWVDKGKGPLYIVKNKSTGKTRVLMKIPPLGRLAMNFSPRTGFNYTCPEGQKQVQAAFIDHFEKSESDAGRPSFWNIQVREAKDAQEIARILTEERS